MLLKKIKMRNRGPKLKIIFAALTAVLAVSFLFFVWARRSNDAEAGALDSFAKCLSEKNIAMYGADWCPHCQNEKKQFGDSFRFITYIECPLDPKRCLASGITGYPTWIFPDGYSPAGSPVKGKKLEGEQGLEKLSAESGCPLPGRKP